MRDPRGFAVKLYTEEGNWDLVGNNTPIFFIRDPLMVSCVFVVSMTTCWVLPTLMVLKSVKYVTILLIACYICWISMYQLEIKLFSINDRTVIGL